MNVREWMKDFGKRLMVDAPIAEFCRKNYEKTLTVQVGQTQKNPISSDACPLILLVAYGRGTTDDGELKNRGVRISAFIFGNDVLEQDADGIFHVPGCELLEEFMELIEKFIVRYREISGKSITTMPQNGPEDSIDQGIFSAGLALGVQLDSDYND